MALKFRFITAEASHAIAKIVAANDPPYGTKQNTRILLTIAALSATNLYLLYGNGFPGETDTDFPSPLSVQSSARINSGSFVVPGTISIARGTRANTLPISGLSPTFGQTLEICTFADGGAKYVPVVHHIRPTWGQQLTATTASLAGALTATGISTPSENTAYTPFGAIGKSATKGIVNLGHSVTGGQVSAYYKGYSQYAALSLGVPCFQGGSAGSGPGGWDTAEKSLLNYGDSLVLHWWINAINEAKIAGTTPSAFVAVNRVTAKTIIGDAKALGFSSVIMCTEGPASATDAQTLALLAAWNAEVRANGVSYMGADAVLDIANVLFTSTDSGILKSEFGGGSDIHWGDAGHIAVGAALETLYRTSTFLGQDTQRYQQTFREDFYGGATVRGADFGSWTQFQTSISPESLYRTAGGYLAIDAAGTLAVNNYLKHTSITQTQGMVEFSGVWTDPAVDDDGPGCGWCLDTEGVGGRLYGYIAFLARNNKLYIQKTHAGGVVNSSSALTNGAIQVGQNFRITIERTNSTGSGSDIVAKVYRGSGVAEATVTIADDTTALLARNAMKPCLVFQGNTVDPPSIPKLMDFANIYDYVPYVISSVIPNVSSATVTTNTAFTGTVVGSGSFPADVTFEIASGAGSIGLHSGIYIPPSQTGSIQSAVVRLVSAGREATTTIAITIPATGGGGSTITGVTIPIGNITVAGGSTTTITPVVTGTGGFDSSTTLTKQSGPGSVSGNNYIAPATTGSVQTAVVRQTSNQNGAFFAEITITIPATVIVPPTVTQVVCTNGNLIFQNGGASVDLDATVLGTNSPSQSVTFELFSGLGTLNTASGVYTSPAAMSFLQTAIVIIRSVQDPTKTCVVTIATSLVLPDTSYTYAGGGSLVGNHGVIVPVGVTQNVEMLPTTWRLVCDTAHAMLIQVLSGEVVFFLAASLPSSLAGETLVLTEGQQEIFAPSGIKLYARSRDFNVSAYIAKTPVNA